MSSCLICYPDRLLPSASYSPILSNGSWLSTLPLINLQDPLLGKKARSTNALATSTKFDADLGTSRAVRVIYVARHNAGSDATIRVRGYSDAGYTNLVCDTGAVSMWPEGYPAAENKKRYQDDFCIIFNTDQTARYWRNEVVDTANPSGYFEMSRFEFLPAFQPGANMLYGATIGLATDTSKQRTKGGVDYWDRSEPRRTQAFTLTDLSQAEAFDKVFDMQWDRGIDGELLFIHDPADTGIMLKRRSFLCTLRELSPIEYPYGDGHKSAFVVEEIL